MVGMTDEGEIGNVLQDLGRAVGSHPTGAHEAAKRLDDFNVDQVRGVNRRVVREHPGLDSRAGRGPQQPFDRG